jgi:hypothetical protein
VSHKRLHQHIEVRRRPEGRSRLSRRGAVRGAKAPSVTRNHCIRRNLVDAGGVVWPKDRRQRCCQVCIEVGDCRLKVRRIAAVVVPLAIRIFPSSALISTTDSND